MAFTTASAVCGHVGGVERGVEVLVRQKRDAAPRGGALPVRLAGMSGLFWNHTSGISTNSVMQAAQMMIAVMLPAVTSPVSAIRLIAAR